MVVNAFEDRDDCGPVDGLLGSEFGRPSRDAEDTTVQVKADDLGHHLGARPEEWHGAGIGRRHQARRQLVESTVHPEECVRREAGGHHALHHEDPFGDHQPFTERAPRQHRQIWPAVDGVEVAKVVEPLIVGVDNVDDLHRECRRGGHPRYGSRMASGPDLQFRPAIDSDWPEIFAADARAFGITAPIDEYQRANSRARINNEDIVVVRDPALPGDPLVGKAMYYRLTMSVPGGGRLDFPGLTWVSVAPTHRRRGILRELIMRLRTKWAQEGQPIAALWASEATIYGRFGFGPAVFAEDVRIDERQSLRLPAPAQAQVRFATAEEFAGHAPALYDRWADVHPGVMSRDLLWWQSVLDDRPAHRLITTGERQYLLHPDGYAVYHLDTANTGPDNLPAAHVDEVVAVTDEAHTELWRILASLDLVATTTATLPVGDPLPFKLADLRGVKTTSRHDTLWIAILDVADALGARTYAADIDTTLVVDDPLGTTGGRYRLRIVDGSPDVVPGDGAAGEIACDITVLASLFFGAVDARALAAAGRVRASDPELLTAFAAVWRTQSPPATGTDF